MEQSSTPSSVSPYGLFGFYKKHRQGRTISTTTQEYEKCMLKLQKLDNKIHVDGFRASIESTMYYKNTSGCVLDLEFRRPIDEEWTFFGLWAKVGDRTIVANCREKKEANMIYQKAKKEGRIAILAEEDDDFSDVARIKLGNVYADENVEIHAQFLLKMKIGFKGRASSLILPNILNNRFHQFHSLKKKEDATATFGCMSNSVVVEGSRIIKNISVVQPQDEGYDSKITRNKAYLTHSLNKCSNSDWEMEIVYENALEPDIILEQGVPDGNETSELMKSQVLMVNHILNVPEETTTMKKPPPAMLLILDYSGSMHHTSNGPARIDYAAAAANIWLQALPKGCIFNVIKFGTDFKVLRKRDYLEKNAMNIELAQEFINKKDNMGGTNLYDVLEHVYSDRRVERELKLLIITDGEANGVNRMKALVADHSCWAKVFTIGVGQGASSALVKGLAVSGKGEYEMILSNAKLVDKTKSLVSLMQSHSAEGIKLVCILEGGEEKGKVLDSNKKIIYADQHLVKFVQIPKDKKIKNLTLNVPNFAPMNLDTSSIFEKPEKTKTIHCLAAKEMIKDLEEKIDVFKPNDSLHMGESVFREDIKKQIVDISEASGIISRYTAFIGEDDIAKRHVTGRKSRGLSVQTDGCDGYDGHDGYDGYDGPSTTRSFCCSIRQSSSRANASQIPKLILSQTIRGSWTDLGKVLALVGVEESEENFKLLLIEKIGMKSEEFRLDTFENWPLNFKKVTPETLAKQGYFSTKDGDKCKCAFCGLTNYKWSEEDTPFQEHTKYNKNCLFLKGEQAGNLSRDFAGNDEQLATALALTYIKKYGAHECKEHVTQYQQGIDFLYPFDVLMDYMYYFL